MGEMVANPKMVEALNSKITVENLSSGITHNANLTVWTKLVYRIGKLVVCTFNGIASSNAGTDDALFYGLPKGRTFISFTASANGTHTACRAKMENSTTLTNDTSPIAGKYFNIQFCYIQSD